MKFSELKENIIKEAKILAINKDEESIDASYAISTIGKEFILHLEYETKEDGERYIGLIKAFIDPGSTSSFASNYNTILEIYLDPYIDLKVKDSSIKEDVNLATKKWLEKHTKEITDKYKKAADLFDETLKNEISLINCMKINLNGKKLK